MEEPKNEKPDDEYSSEEDDPFLTLPNDVSDLLSIDKFEVEEDEEEAQDSDKGTKKVKERKAKKKKTSRKEKKSAKTKIKKEKDEEKILRRKLRSRVEYPCSKCSEVFHHVRLFNDHQLSHEPEDCQNKKKYKCPYAKCEREFGSEIGLKNHLNFHTSSSETLSCSFCDEGFETVEKLDMHIVESHKKEIDDLGHSYSSPLDKLKRNLKRKMWHKCDRCDKQFGNVIIYKKHLLTHQDLENNPDPDSYKCNCCGREFYSEHGLRVHHRNSDCKAELGSIPNTSDQSLDATLNINEETIQSLKCSDCPLEFKGALKLDIHLVSVHLKEPKCSQCGKIFPNGARLFRHHNVHKLPSFKCGHENCGIAFRTKEGLVVHRRKHEGIQPYVCTVCQEGFKTKPLWVLHRIQAHGQNLKPIVNNSKPRSRVSHAKYPCPTSGCEAVFKYEKSLIIHQRKHLGLLPYVCPTCQQGFEMKQQCIQHRIEAHNEIARTIALAQTSMCDTCGQTFRNPYTLKNHITREHTTEKNFECEVCGKKFALEYDYKVHKSYHAGTRSFTCEECGKSFNSKGDLVRHTWSHKSDTEKPYQCQFCGKGFARKSHLDRHTKKHKDGAKFRRSFPKSKNLTIISEQGDVFTCPYCGKTCTSKDAHRSHVRRVHGRDSQGNLVGVPAPRIYTCDLCSKLFHKKSRLVDHYKFVHLMEYKDRKTNQHHSSETVSKKLVQLPQVPMTNNNVNSFHPTIDGPQQIFPPYFENSNKLSTDCVVTTAAQLLGAPFSGFQQPQQQPFYPDITTIVNSDLATKNDGHNLTDQTRQSNSSMSIVSNPTVAGSTSDYNSVSVEPSLPEINQIIIPPVKWESTYEPEMELDDFFDNSSQDSIFDDITNTAPSTSGIKKEVSPEKPVMYAQDKNPKLKLTEVDKSQIKKFIGSRCFSLHIRRLKIYSCKLCAVDFHKEDFYEKHCRSVRHLISIRRINDKTLAVSKTEESTEIVAVPAVTVSDLDDSRLKETCSICGLSFDTLKFLLEHCKTKHEGKRAFPCNLCGKSYFSFKNLRSHKTTFHKAGDFVCIICKEKFYAYETYRNHITTSHKDEEKKCPLCPTTFNTLKKLTDHCEFEHRGQKPFKCDICGAAYFRYKDYRNHASRFHAEDDPNDPSTISKPAFGRKKQLSATVCDVCGKSFSHGCRLKAHMSVHTGEKSHLCDLCGRSFRKKQSLAVHKKRHLGETSFACPECGKKFYRKRDLRLHLEVHTKTKTYRCRICKLKFNTETELEEHKVVIHHHKIPGPTNSLFTCTICGMALIHSDSLANHLATHHSNLNYLM